MGKCAAHKVEGTGILSAIVCGTGQPVWTSFGGNPKSWIVIYQTANGARQIAGIGKRWWGSI